MRSVIRSFHAACPLTHTRQRWKVGVIYTRTCSNTPHIWKDASCAFLSGRLSGQPWLKSLFALFVPWDEFVCVCKWCFMPSPGYEALISPAPQRPFNPSFPPHRSSCLHLCGEPLLYLLWSRLCLQQPGVLIASIHYSALLRLYHTPKQHRNKTRLRIGMKCVSADQVVGRWAGGSQDWEVWAFTVHHLLLIALVLRLWASPWSLMHVRNNVFTCSHALCMGREGGCSVVEDPLPTGLVFSVCVCADLHSATL